MNSSSSLSGRTLRLARVGSGATVWSLDSHSPGPIGIAVAPTPTPGLSGLRYINSFSRASRNTSASAGAGDGTPYSEVTTPVIAVWPPGTPALLSIAGSAAAPVVGSRAGAAAALGVGLPASMRGHSTRASAASASAATSPTTGSQAAGAGRTSTSTGGGGGLVYMAGAMVRLTSSQGDSEGDGAAGSSGYYAPSGGGSATAAAMSYDAAGALELMGIGTGLPPSSADGSALSPLPGSVYGRSQSSRGGRDSVSEEAGSSPIALSRHATASSLPVPAPSSSAAAAATATAHSASAVGSAADDASSWLSPRQAMAARLARRVGASLAGSGSAPSSPGGGGGSHGGSAEASPHRKR